MSDNDRITKEEMIQMFGEVMPTEAVKLLWESDGSRTIGEVRAELREIARNMRDEPGRMFHFSC